MGSWVRFHPWVAGFSPSLSLIFLVKCPPSTGHPRSQGSGELPKREVFPQKWVASPKRARSLWRPKKEKGDPKKKKEKHHPVGGFLLLGGRLPFAVDGTCDPGASHEHGMTTGETTKI